MGRDPGIGEREEAREPEIGHHDHHAQEQRDRVEIDGPIGLLERERPDATMRPPRPRDAGPVDAEPGTRPIASAR